MMTLIRRDYKTTKKHFKYFVKYFAQWKGAILYTRKDGPGGEMTFAPLQTKEILTSVLDEKSQPDASCEQNKASPDVEKTDCKTASLQVPLASSERKNT